MSSFFKHSTKWIISDIFEIPFKFAMYFILASSLDKESFAVLNLSMMIFSYYFVSQMGVFNYLSFELPKRYAQSRSNSGLINESFTFTLTNQIVIYTFTTVSLIFFSQSYLLILACIAYIFQSFFYNSYIHQVSSLRYKYEFDKVLIVRVIFSVTRFVLQYYAFSTYGIYGYLLIEAVSFLLPVIVFWFIFDVKINIVPILSKYKKLLIIGSPFFVVVLLSTILGNIDRWFVVSFFGMQAFASYSVAIYICTAILIVPGKVLSILIQYSKEFYSSKVHDIDAIDALYSTFGLLSFALAVLLLFVSYVFAHIISIYLPKYSDILPLVNPLMLFIFLKFNSSIANNMLYILEKKKTVLKVQVCAIIIYMLTFLLIYYFSLDYIFVLWMANATLFFQIIFCNYLIFNYSDKKIDIEASKYLVVICITTTYYLAREYLVFDYVNLCYSILILIAFFYSFDVTIKKIIFIFMRRFKEI